MAPIGPPRRRLDRCAGYGARVPLLVVTVVLLVLTIVFDNAMIAAGLMTYSEQAVSGARIGLVPVEDLAYPLAGLLLLPGLWILFRRRPA